MVGVICDGPLAGRAARIPVIRLKAKSERQGNGRFEACNGDTQTLVFVGCQQWFATPGRQSKVGLGDAIVRVAGAPELGNPRW